MVLVAATAIGLLLGIGLVDEAPETVSAGSPQSLVPTASISPQTTQIGSTTAPVATTPIEPPATSAPSVPATPQTVVEYVEVAELPPSAENWELRARKLGPLAPPATCAEVPLQDSASLPNSPRDYRSGVHQGIDFICGDFGASATTPLAGRVVMMVNNFVDPIPSDRNSLLSIASQTGSTPPWTLAMLYGNFVVVDHGVIPDVGHTVTVYAHLDSVDSGLRLGQQVQAGQELGLIGRTGTSTSASGGDRPQSIHLHWELYVDDVYFGAGLGEGARTSQLYQTLFGLE